MSFCTATYRIHDDQADFHSTAESIAAGLYAYSRGGLPGLGHEQPGKAAGRVESIVVHEPENASPGERYADIIVAYPDTYFPKSLSALLLVAYGRLSLDGKIRLLNLGLSETFLSAFSGPKFGISGVRELLDRPARPLLMSHLKPDADFDLNGLKTQFMVQALSGVDLIRDDEVSFDHPDSPWERRAEIGRLAADEAGKFTGKKLLYAVNLSGKPSELRSRAKRAVDAGASALLFSPLAYGIDLLQELAVDPDISVPILASPSLAGACLPTGPHGLSPALLLGKLMRVAGADLVLFPAPYGPSAMEHAEALSIHEELTRDSLPLRPGFPVPSGLIHPGQVPQILKDFGTDVVIDGGTAIHGHPGGAQAGGQAFLQAIDAAVNGVPLEEAAQKLPELKQALELWGTLS